MKRTHVHFATAPHHLRNNKWAEVYLRLDLQVRMQMTARGMACWPDRQEGKVLSLLT